MACKKVLMISIDDLRFDCVGYQQDKRELEKHDVLKYLQTPTLDSISEGSLCFTQCISTNPYTTASHGSILTGLYPPRHGIRAFYHTRLNRDVKTLPEILKEEGYRTILYTDGLELFGPVGLDRGFDIIMSSDDRKLFNLLKELQDEKVFLFCHLMDVHEPFLKCHYEYEEGVNNDFNHLLREFYTRYGTLDGSPMRWWGKLLEGPLSKRPLDILFPLYVKGITKFDRGRFRFFMDNTRELGFNDDALMVIFADHGEGRCLPSDKAFFGHGGLLYDNVIRIPLIVQHPDLEPGIDDRLVSSVDIFPMILSLLNIDFDKNKIDGITPLSSDRRDFAYSETWAVNTAIVTAKCIKKETDFVKTQMSLRTKDRKYVMWNKGLVEYFFDMEVFAQPHDVYVKSLFKYLLGRFADPENSRFWVQMLTDNKITKDRLLMDFMNSDEYRAVPKFCVHLLKEDPEEDNPVDASLYPETYKYFDQIMEIDLKSVKTDTIFEEDVPARVPGHSSEEREQEKIMDKLRDLGYFL